MDISHSFVFVLVGLFCLALEPSMTAMRCGKCWCMDSKIICRDVAVNVELVPNKNLIKTLDFRGVRNEIVIQQFIDSFPALNLIDLRNTGECVHKLDRKMLSEIIILSDCWTSVNTDPDITTETLIAKTNKKRPRIKVISATTTTSINTTTSTASFMITSEDIHQKHVLVILSITIPIISVLFIAIITTIC